MEFPILCLPLTQIPRVSVHTSCQLELRVGQWWGCWSPEAVNQKRVFPYSLGERLSIWIFPKIGVPQNGWFIMEKPIKMDDLGVAFWVDFWGKIVAICSRETTFFKQPSIVQSPHFHPKSLLEMKGCRLDLTNDGVQPAHMCWHVAYYGDNVAYPKVQTWPTPKTGPGWRPPWRPLAVKKRLVISTSGALAQQN